MVSSNISPLAVIEEGATIGTDVTIAPFCFISAKATIGDGTSLAQGAYIYGKTTIGKNNKIYSYAVLGSDPQDLKFNGEDVELIIGDNNTIREFTLLNPGTEGGGRKTIVGNNNLLMGYVHLGHDVIVGDNCIIANSAGIAGHVEIGNHVVIGAGGVGIHQFVKIGDYAMVGGASALTQDVPPFCMAEGNRATLRGLNINGMRRKFERSDINDVKAAYRELFESGKPLKECATELLNSSENIYVKDLCNFAIDTKRGIPYTRKENDS